MSKKEKYNYYDEFTRMANDIVESSKILNETLKNYSKENAVENSVRVHELENDSDNALHEIKSCLIKDFLPPINREDISTIGNMLDDVEDEVDEILINFNILNVRNLRDIAYEFGDILSKCSVALKETVDDFKNFKKVDVSKKFIEVNKLEEEGDRIYSRAMTELYEHEVNSIEIIKWTRIFNSFEDAIDACENAASIIEDVILKNS